MSAVSISSPPSSNLVDPAYLYLTGLGEKLTTHDLFLADPDQYKNYCEWYESREDSRTVMNTRRTLEVRLAAYLRLVERQGQRFILGANTIPSAKWLRDRLGIHRNTMAKYIREARTTGRVNFSLAVGCQLAFAAAIYPPESKHEKKAVNGLLQNRLDLIDDYHLTGKKKTKMVRILTPITRSGRNRLFTVEKSYPLRYDLDSKGWPIKRISEHTPRKSANKSK